MSQRDFNSEDLPKPIRSGLDEIYHRPLDVPATVDRAILASARTLWARRRRAMRIWRWSGMGAGVAAAAAIALIVRMEVMRSEHATPARSPIATMIDPGLNRDRPITIAEAFRLARLLRDEHAGQHPAASWDFNGDGKVDERDVQALAAEAVRLDRG
jgi:hypothetical protein